MLTVDLPTRPPSPAAAEEAEAPAAAMHVTAEVRAGPALPRPAVSGGRSAAEAAEAPQPDVQLSPATASLLSQVTKGWAETCCALSC